MKDRMKDEQTNSNVYLLLSLTSIVKKSIDDDGGR